jgi:uncharacterized integral membrane protein
MGSDHVTSEPEHPPAQAARTRTSSTWFALAIGVIFLVLLITFIAQNNRKVPLHFLGWSGNVSEALAIVGSAIAGAVLVLVVGVARIVQLRVGRRRHNREVVKQERAQAKADRSGRRGNRYVSATPADGEADAVDPEE